jgi:hypothetical protein
MGTTKKTIKLIVEKTNTGYSAFATDYPIFTTSNSIIELQNNAFEAACLYFEDEIGNELSEISLIHR